MLFPAISASYPHQRHCRRRHPMPITKTTGNRLTEPRRSTSNADPLKAEPASVRLVDSFASSVRQRVPGTLADNSRHSRHSFPGLTLSLAVRKRGTLSSSQGQTPCRKLPMPAHASITLRLPFHTTRLSDARLQPFGCFLAPNWYPFANAGSNHRPLASSHPWDPRNELERQERCE